MQKLYLFFLSILLITLSSCNDNKEDASTPTPTLEAITLSGGSNLFPEGIAIDQRNGDIYVGSTGENSIQKVSNGEVSFFKDTGEDDLESILGMAIDENNDRLWVCHNVATSQTSSTGFVSVFSLSNGTELANFQASGTANFLNDITIDPAGNAYITNSFGGNIFTVDKDLTSLSEYLRSSDFTNITGRAFNGIRITPDNKYLLIVANGNTDAILYRVELSNKEITEVAVNSTFRNGDGLVFINNSQMLAINTTEIIALDFNSDYSEATAKDALDGKEDVKALINDPTTGKIYNQTLYVVNSQFSANVGELPFTITSIPLTDLAL